MGRTQLLGSVTTPKGEVAGLILEAWSTLPIDEPLASTVVDAGGGFRIAVDEQAVADRRLRFRFFSGTAQIAALEHDLDGGGPITLELPDAPAQAAPRGPVHAVRGRVRAGDGTPIVGARVRAFDRELRREELLGETETDAGGGYEVRYRARAGKRAADLVVRVYRSEDQVALESQVRFNAPAHARVDLEAGPGVRPGLSVHAQIAAAVAPILDGDITEKDLPFLAGKTGLPEELLADYERAEHLGALAGVAPAACFAFLRQGLPPSLDGLLSVTRADLEAALAAAVADGLVPLDLDGDAANIIGRVIKLRTAHPLRRPADTSEVTFGVLLTAGGVPRRVQEAFVRLVAAHSGPAEHLWRKLEIHPDGGAGPVADLQFLLQAAALGRGNVAFVEMLAGLRARRHIASLRDLAGLEPAAWRQRLDDAGILDEDRRDAFARWLSATLEAGFPTPALAQRLLGDAKQAKRPAARFLHEHPDFDLATARVREHTSDADTVADLELVQRLFRLSPRYRHVRAIEQAGFDSALVIADGGLSAFVRALGGALSDQEAERIHSAACRVAMSSLAHFAEHSADLNAPAVAAIPAAARETLPGLAELIGARRFCECADCRSVLGPAAYLADLLNFLHDCPTADGRSAKEVLFADRRADLGELPLSCANVQTLVPRIDLVIELLEHAVAREAEPAGRSKAAATTLAAATFPLGLPFDLAWSQARIYLEHIGVPRHEIMATFQRRDRTAPTDLEIAAEELGFLPAELELVSGGFKQAAAARVCTRGPVTLRGLPATDGVSLVSGDRVLVKHQENPADDGVYVASARAWTRAADGVPNLGLLVEVEEGTSRGTWVLTDEGFERLRPPGETDVLPRKPWVYWGFPDDGSITEWPAPIANVDTLLARTGLERPELDELLAAEWVNPAGDARMAVDHQTVVNLTPAAARRILRFVKLRRRLGLPIPDLDRIIRVLAPHEIADRFLGTLAELRHLAAAAGVTVAELLPLYSELEGDEYARLSGGAPDGEEMSAHVEPLAAALGIAPDELTVLINDEAAQKLGLEEAPVPDHLTRSNLSRLYRRVVLARAAKLTIQELLVLLALSKIAPFDRDHVEEAARVVACAGKLRAAGLTIPDLDDLLRGVGAPADAAALEALRAARDQGDEALVQALAAVIGVEPAVAQTLAADAIHTALPALREGGDAAVGALAKLRRAAILVAKLRLGTDLAWLAKHGADLGALDLETLPEGPASFEDAAVRFGPLERLLDTVAVRDALAPGALVAILTPALDDDSDNARGACFAALGQRLGWAVADIEAVVAGLGFSFPRDFRDARTVARLVACHALRRRTGVEAARLLGWRGSPLTLADADDVVAAIRQRGGDFAALEARVRSARRDALVLYLLHVRGLPDAGTLSEHFLVDVTTDDATRVSRIEQAHGSVQRFINRCLLGLEPAVALTPDDLRRWRLVQDFKVWRETRRVALHPENHLAALRERTPFFAAFERALAAGPVDEALRRYLEELDGVARLEIVGLFEDGGGDLHIVGRTSGVPHLHYYRRRTGAEWGPWEPVGGDLSDDAILPVAWKGRVALLWPVVSAGGIRLAWSERMPGGWTAKRIGTDTLPAAGSCFAFRTRFGADGEPLVTVLADTRAPAAMPGGPSIGAARRVPAAVVGAFRLSRRGPVVVDGGAAEILLQPRPSARQLRLPREDGMDVLVLKRAPARPRVTAPHQAGASSPVVFDDGERSWLVTLTGATDIPWREPQKWMPWHVDVAMQKPLDGEAPSADGRRLFPRPELGRYRFERLYHPTASELLRRFGHDGIDSVFAPAEEGTRFSFDASFEPAPGVVDDERPAESIDLTGGPYAQYQWELRLHAPLLAATRLMAEKRFAEAQRWLHYVFDPSDAQRQFWKLPFRAVLGLDGWLRAPKDPHRVARARSGAYQRAVVMTYLDNLIAWGDHLLESQQSEAAALLYRAAEGILGPRPVPAPAQATEAPTFNQLVSAKSNVLAAIENLLPGCADDRPAQVGEGIEAVLALARTLTSFCVPVNEVLLGYWDTVAERLKRLA
jgi:hypothetical protein